MRRTIATTIGIAALLATSAPAQAQSGPQRLTKAGAESRLEAALAKRGGESLDARCRRPKRGKAICAATYTKASGRQCSDSRVTVVRKRRGLKVKGLNPVCTAPAPQPAPAPDPVPAQPDPETTPVDPPADVPEEGSTDLPLLDLIGGAPVGPPPGIQAADAEPAAGATASSAGPRARAASGSFLGCSNWMPDLWWGQWWMYYCVWSYSSAPPGAHLIGWQTNYVAEIYYWTGSQAAFWFRHEWTA